jgi:hypothetical protein
MLRSNRTSVSSGCRWGKAKYVGRKFSGMDCPQCDGTLATYALGGQEASVCEDCGYVGIPAEHRGEPRRIESWNDALRRFYRAHGADAKPGVELRQPLSRPSEGSTGESWDDALRRFHERRTGDDGPQTDAEDGDGDGDGDGADPDDESDATPSGGSGTERAADASTVGTGGADGSVADGAGDGDEATTETGASQSSAGDS